MEGGDAEVRQILQRDLALQRRKQLYIFLSQLSLGAVFIILWQLFSGRWLDPFWFSSPSRIGQYIADWFITGSIWTHIWSTFVSMSTGFVCASALAIILGFLLGQFTLISKVLDPYIMMLFSLPKIALGPLFIIWFGLGYYSSFMMVIAMVFFPVFYNILSGVRTIDTELINMSRIMGANRLQIMTKIIFPATRPWIIVGLKLATPYSIIGAVIGEMLGSNKGLGFLIQYYAGQYDSTGVFTGLLVLTIIAFLIDTASKKLENTTPNRH